MSLTKTKKLGCLVADSLKAQAPLLAFSGIYAALAVILTPITIAGLILGGLGPFLFLIFSLVILLFIIKSVALFFEMMLKIQPKRPLKYWFGEMKAYSTQQVRWSYTLPLLTALYIFIAAFTAFKSQIAVAYPFAFDIAMHKLDVLLHFGRAPWEWLHEIFSHPVWSIVFGYIYNLWFFIIIYAFFLSCFGYRKYEFGIRYLIASLLLWSVAGNGLAFLFSSAGPCFYGLLELGSAPYAGLMTRLNDISENYSTILSLNVQNMLWEGYQTHNSGETGGISAFPSLHVASSVLVARAAFAQKLSIRWFLVVFAALILIGSVYLGWHYAIDGYAGIVLGLLAWTASAPISKWYIKRAEFAQCKGL